MSFVPFHSDLNSPKISIASIKKEFLACIGGAELDISELCEAIYTAYLKL
jgi:hypothetical protein